MMPVSPIRGAKPEPPHAYPAGMPLTVLTSREPITVEVVHDTESPQFLAPRIPSECPVCGAYSLAPEANVSVLLAVCDVLVLKALEKMGNFIVRAERQRYQVIGDKPKYMAHTIWTPTEDVVAKAIRGAWDVVPILLQTHSGCCSFDAGLVVELLDLYVRDLAITGSEHDIDELAYRLRTKLSLPVYRTVVE